MNMKKIKVLLLSLFVCLIGNSSVPKAFFCPPAPGVVITGDIPKSDVHYIPDIENLMKLEPGKRAQAIGSTGAKKVAVILVNFKSAGSSTSGSPTMSSSDIQNVSTYMSGLRNYYLEASRNNLTVEPTYVYSGGTKTYPSTLNGSETPFTMNNSMESYQTASNLVGEALTAANNSGISVAKTSFTPPGIYDAVLIIHAGYGEASTGKSGDIWPAFWTSSSIGYGFGEGIATSVRAKEGASAFGTLVHEFGHQLGLPDLYNTSNNKYTMIGKWCLMANGGWNGSTPGSTPAHLSAWCKQLLGWSSPESITVSSSMVQKKVYNSAEYNTSSMYKFPLYSTTEYYLIEYRRNVSYDSALPGDGILIWHIDDSVGSISSNNVNNSLYRPRVLLEEADKGDDIIYGLDAGSSTDPYRTGADILTKPYNYSYNTAASSGITLAAFSGVGNPYMTFTASPFSVTTNLQVKKVFGFPSPSRNGTPVRIRAIFSRPIVSGNIKIYTIAGELVKSAEITGDDIKTSASKNDEWVYQYQWDLKNSFGMDVSPGVYIYVVEALISDTEKQIKVGKIAIIR